MVRDGIRATVETPGATHIVRDGVIMEGVKNGARVGGVLDQGATGQIAPVKVIPVG